MYLTNMYRNVEIISHDCDMSLAKTKCLCFQGAWNNFGKKYFENKIDFPIKTYEKVSRGRSDFGCSLCVVIIFLTNKNSKN